MKVMYVGCDVAKHEVVVAVSVKGGLIKLPAVVNDPEGFKGLGRELKKLQQTHRGYTIQVMIEPTGGYEMGLASFGHQQGWQVGLVNPRQVREWASSQGQRAKTDEWDAQMLAEYGAGRPKNKPLPLWQPLPASLAQLDSLLNRRRDLEQMLLQESNRHYIYATRPGLDPAVLSSLTTLIATLEQSLAEVQQAIHDHIRADPHLREQIDPLDSIPGVGEKVVLPLYVLLAKWQVITHGLGSAKALTAFVGLDAQTRQSGQSTRRGGISETGDPEMRRLLYMAALGGKRGQNPLHDFFDRLVGNGKLRMAVLVAAVRKILLWAWAVFRSHTDFDPKMCTKTA